MPSPARRLKGGAVNRNIILAVVAVALAFGASVAFAATQTTASAGTNVCVNDTNGLVRVADTCRAGEHPLTIGGGGGGNAQVTQNGTFTLAGGETSVAKALPLTGVSVSGRCIVAPSPFPGLSDGIAALAVAEAAGGATMDIFRPGGGGNPVGQSSTILGGFGAPPGTTIAGSGALTAIVSSNGATATIIVGAYGDPNSKTCTFLWQAVEAPN
jgi:hypothetical protein